jgi:hypothetical protein
MADIEYTNPYHFKKDDLLTGIFLSALVVIVVAGYALIAPSSKSKAKEDQRQASQASGGKAGACCLAVPSLFCAPPCSFSELTGWSRSLLRALQARHGEAM